MPVWAALRQLGVDGLARVVDRCCAMAERYAEALGSASGVEVMHQELNQVVIRFFSASGESDDEHTRQVVAKVQTSWHLLSDAHGMAQLSRDADLGLQLANRRGGRRPLCGFYPGGPFRPLRPWPVRASRLVVGTGIDPVTSRFSGARSTN